MKITRVYLDIDLRCSFQGLRKQLVADGLKIDLLSKGSMIIFLNRAGTKFKLLAGNDYLVYYNNGDRRIPLDAIKYLPSYFDGTTASFDKVVEKSIRAKLNLE